MNKFSKIIKAWTMFKIFLQECFCSCQVVKMSAYFDSKGKLIIANWGDDINYWFLNEICNDKIVSYDWSILTRVFRRSYVMGIGSILTMFDIENSIVWGSGILLPNKPFVGRPKEVKAVRGPLTRQKLIDAGINCPEVYGDPALLLPLFYTPSVKKVYKLGIIQQHASIGNPLLDGVRNDEDVLIINIGKYNHWLDIIDQVCMCETIISSSLHGLIISEAYKVPNVWTFIKGDNPESFFKYHDFFMALGADREPFIVNEILKREDISLKMKDWKPSNFDAKKLLDSCPLRLKSFIQLSK